MTTAAYGNAGRRDLFLGDAQSLRLLPPALHHEPFIVGAERGLRAQHRQKPFQGVLLGYSRRLELPAGWAGGIGQPDSALHCPSSVDAATGYSSGKRLLAGVRRRQHLDLSAWARMPITEGGHDAEALR